MEKKKRGSAPGRIWVRENIGPPETNFKGEGSGRSKGKCNSTAEEVVDAGLTVDKLWGRGRNPNSERSN